MRDFRIDLIWTKIQIAVAALGGWLGYSWEVWTAC